MGAVLGISVKPCRLSGGLSHRPLTASPAQAACDEKAGPKVDWHSCDEHSARLNGADLSRANLTNAKLTHAYLVGAKLSDANLSGATWSDGQKQCAAGSIGKCN